MRRSRTITTEPAVIDNADVLREAMLLLDTAKLQIVSEREWYRVFDLALKADPALKVKTVCWTAAP